MKTKRKTLRKTSKTSKKGTLERIYKEYTLPRVFFKNNGLCVICGFSKATDGHHIYGRTPAFYHIHPDMVVPVCRGCHMMEKSTDHKESRGFKKTAEKWVFANSTMKIEHHNPIIWMEEWVTDKLLEFGYKF